MKILDLFSGIGGMSIGLERAGMETAAFCEIDPFAISVLRHHWPNTILFEDVTRLNSRELEKHGMGPIDLICGGFPCQDLSASGSGKGLDGTRSGLFYEIIRLTSELRPKYVLMENSPRLLSGAGGKWARRVFGALAEIGYDAEWDIIPASYLGAPHRRERVWIVAYPIGERQPKQRRFKYAFHPKEDRYREASGLVYAFQRKSLPYVCRGHDEFPCPMDSLRCYGNAVVPDVAEMIGRAIMEYERISPA